MTTSPEPDGAEVDYADEALLRLDPDGTSQFLDFFGRKNSGKTHLALMFTRSWPYDGLIINPTGDVDPHHEWSLPWPGGTDWPERPEGLDHVMWNYRPDMRKASIVPGTRPALKEWQKELDAILLSFHDAGAGGAPPRFLHVDEVRVLKNLPSVELVLHEGRHNGDWAAFCGPRPMDIDVLILAQADEVFVFHMPSVHDIDRVAKTCGIAEADLRLWVSTLDEHQFLRIDQNAHTVTLYPPLPS